MWIAPAHAVDRPALRGRLDAGLSSPLTLVVAPAGAGKTVLLSQWVRSHPDLTVAWLDVSAMATDAGAFSRKLTGAMASAVPTLNSLTTSLGTSEHRPGRPYLEEFAAALEDAGVAVVIFDGVDRVQDDAVLADLGRLVDMLPPGTHFVFSSRKDLRLGWSHQRLHHRLVEIRQRDLAFDLSTTAQVLEHVTQRRVSAPTVAEVTTRTEGWAAGVELTALGMRFTAEPHLFVETTADTDRFVIDYLSEEVLDTLDADRQAALLTLAALDEVTASLAESVTGVDGARLLEELERDSMFIVPLEGRPGWYRFHRLFRDLLVLRLRAQDPQHETEVLETAAKWYLTEGEEETAIDYLVRARSWDEVLTRVLAVGGDFSDVPGMTRVAGWLSQVPPRILAENTEAVLLLALANAVTGNPMAAIDALRALLGDDRLDAGQRQVALVYLAACVQFHPHPEFFLDIGREALAELTQHPDVVLPDLRELTSRPVLAIVGEAALGRAHLFLGDFAEARRIFTSVLTTVGMAYRPHRIHTLGTLALVEATAGRLVAATDCADEALSLATESDLLDHPVSADAYLAKAIIAVQRGEADAAAPHLREAIRRAEANQSTQLLWMVWLTSTAMGPQEEIDGAEPTGVRPGYVRDATISLAMLRARRQGAPIAPPSPAAEWSFVAFEEVAGLLTRRRGAEASARLAQLAPEPDPAAPRRAIEYEILRGWAGAVQGRATLARDHLVAALQLAEPEWLVEPFIRAGPMVADLVDDLPGVAGNFRRFVVRRARGPEPPQHHHPVDGFTPRELDLLAYLPSRLTIADIAGRCFVSTNTIKTHLAHIYRKLGVPGRDAAVERATEFGLIEAPERTTAL